MGEILQPFLYKNLNYRRMDHAFSGYDVGTSKFKFQRKKALLENEQFELLINNHYFQPNSPLEFHTNLKNEFQEIQELIEVDLHTEK